MKETSKVVRCKGCSGTGRQPSKLPLGFPRDCPVCGGMGQVRMSSEETWCGRCDGTGLEQKGIPPLHTWGTCHICGGCGIVKI